jgi:hypothetical protein
MRVRENYFSNHFAMEALEMMKRNMGMILLFVLLLLLVRGEESQAFRCGGRLVFEGDSKAEVFYKCGEPDFVDLWEEERILGYVYRPLFREGSWRYVPRGHPPHFTKEYVKIERWTYNFGPSSFIRYLRFENGTLKKIATGSYGYYE